MDNFWDTFNDVEKIDFNVGERYFQHNSILRLKEPSSWWGVMDYLVLGNNNWGRGMESSLFGLLWDVCELDAIKIAHNDHW